MPFTTNISIYGSNDDDDDDDEDKNKCCKQPGTKPLIYMAQ